MSRTVVSEERSRSEASLGAIVSHPTRLRCYVAINERGVRSPNELAGELRLPLRDVAYHVKKLEEYDCIELVDTKQRRGATEHFYTAVRRPYVSDGEWRGMTPEEREQISLCSLQLHFADAALALSTGTFDSRPNRCFIRVPLQVDEEGFDEMNELEERHYRERLEIEARSAQRLRSQPADAAISIATATMFFELPRTGEG